MEPSILYQLLVEIKGDVGEIKGTIRAVAEANEGLEERLTDTEKRLASLEAFKMRLVAVSTAAAGAASFLFNIVPVLWEHFR